MGSGGPTQTKQTKREERDYTDKALACLNARVWKKKVDELGKREWDTDQTKQKGKNATTLMKH